MTILERWNLSRENVRLAKEEIPKAGFDWGDDKESLKKLAVNLVTLAQGTGQGVEWVAGEMERMRVAYQWNMPRGSEVLLPAFASLAWHYPELLAR